MTSVASNRIPRSSVLAVVLLGLLAACGNGETAPCCAGEESAPAATGSLPETSVWQLDSRWTDAAGAERRLAGLRGQIIVAAMIFTNCRYACPTLVSDMKAIRDKLPKDAARYLLVSIDPDRDTPAALRAFAGDHDLGDDWTLLRGDADAVRELAAVLGVNYTRGASGDFAHSNLITVLDREGRAVAQQGGLRADDASIVAAVLEQIDG